MATESRKVQLGFAVDSGEAKQGFAEVKAAGEDLAQSIQRAGRKAATGVEEIGNGAGKAATAMAREERKFVGSLERVIAKMQAGGKAGADYYAILGKERGISDDVLKPYLNRIREVEAAQISAMNTAGLSARANAAALRGVPAQFTDIFTSLQGGQAPLTVLLQQGGQLKDMFGGVGNAAKAMGGYVLGLVTPYTVAAAAAVALGVAYHQGSQEVDGYNRAIIMSGNASGVTAGQLKSHAQAISEIAGTQGNAAQALAEIAQFGKVGGDNIKEFTQAAVLWERTTGTAVSKTAEQFADLKKAPLEATLKLNESMGYLTVSVYEQIKALMEQGRVTEAANVAQKAFADTLDGRSGEMVRNLGSVERGWVAVKDAAKGAWDAILNVGRQSTAEDDLVKVQKKLAANQEQLAKNAGGGLGATVNSFFSKQILAENAGLEAQAAALQGTISQKKAAADQESKDNARVKARGEWDTDGLKYLDNAAKRGREIAIERAKGLAAGATEKEIADRIRDIEEKYKDKKGPSTKGLNTAERRLDLSEIQSTMREELAMVDANGRELELRRQAGAMSDASYYAQKRALIVKSGDIEEEALRKQLARLESEKLKGTDAVNVQRQIAEVKSKLTIKEIDEKTKLGAIDQAADVAAKKREATLKSLTDAHQRYVESLKQQAEREVQAVGMGDKARQRSSGRNAIADRYLQQERALEDQKMFAVAGKTWNSDDEAAYLQRLQFLRQEKEQEVQIYEDTYARIDAAQSRWDLGANRAMENYRDGAANVAGQTEALFTNAFKGAEDALVSFVTTGKGDFKSLVNSAIADLARMEIKSAFSGIGGGSKGGGGGGGFAGALGAIAGFFGFSEGGWTGPGDKHQPKGVVHADEVVWSKDNVRNAGGVQVVEAMRLGRRGYADGGVVEGGAGRGFSSASSSKNEGASRFVYAPVIKVDARADRAAVYSDVQRMLAENNKAYTEQLRRAKVIPA